ncbi:MAG TPA: acylneuraminate cytidylyltransferase family protein [Lentisphaeria bacterium]|nr:MAG: hypothetical protein A2X47_09190 [Lentisphaerae bacterium GWF2_38_69]HBM15427.1 acylneuraminate cytidylyltransferase family protein [Lentisphaeria bacterium]
MYKQKKIVAIITARGGSKALPKKNILPLQGKPLIGWTIDQARNCAYIDEIVVSTDCPEIAKVSEQFGVKVPNLRPAELAMDTASSMDVVAHVLNSLENAGKYFDHIVLLEPTSPLRKKDDLTCAIQQLIDNENADGIISVGEVHMEHPMIVKKITDANRIASYIDDLKKITQRQQADKAYFPYGVIYMVKASVFKAKKMFYTDNVIPYHIERWQNYEIDDIWDFICVEAILNKQCGEL